MPQPPQVCVVHPQLILPAHVPVVGVRHVKMLHVSLVFSQLDMVSEHPIQVNWVSPTMIRQSSMVSLFIGQYTPQVFTVDVHPHNEPQVAFVVSMPPHPPNSPLQVVEVRPQLPSILPHVMEVPTPQFPN